MKLSLVFSRILMGEGGYERVDLPCCQPASWNATNLALTHFECCMTRLVELYILISYKIKHKSKKMKKNGYGVGN